MTHIFIVRLNLFALNHLKGHSTDFTREYNAVYLLWGLLISLWKQLCDVMLPLGRSFIKSAKITPMTSRWCRQGYLSLSLEATNLTPALQTDMDKDVDIDEAGRVALWEM